MVLVAVSQPLHKQAQLKETTLERLSNFLRPTLLLVVVVVVVKKSYALRLIYVHLSSWVFLCVRYVYFV